MACGVPLGLIAFPQARLTLPSDPTGRLPSRRRCGPFRLCEEPVRAAWRPRPAIVLRIGRVPFPGSADFHGAIVRRPQRCSSRLSRSPRRELAACRSIWLAVAGPPFGAFRATHDALWASGPAGAGLFPDSGAAAVDFVGVVPNRGRRWDAPRRVHAGCPRFGLFGGRAAFGPATSAWLRAAVAVAGLPPPERRQTGAPLPRRSGLAALRPRCPVLAGIGADRALRVGETDWLCPVAHLPRGECHGGRQDGTMEMTSDPPGGAKSRAPGRTGLPEGRHCPLSLAEVAGSVSAGTALVPSVSRRTGWHRVPLACLPSATGTGAEAELAADLHPS